MVTIPKTEEPAGILAPDGSLQPGARVEEPPELLLEMYRWMVYGRTYDTRLFSLQRQGRLTTYAPVAGQEAIQVGCGLAMRREDWLLISYRDGLAGLVHGVPPEHLALFFRAHPKAGQVPPDCNTFPIQIGIAEQIPHAVGIAWGMKLRGADTAALALFGDGATSEGAFHEAANFAGVFKVPAVLVAQKAIAYGMPGLQIDGNDPVGVYRTVGEALARARAGEGPTLIEAVTYRLGPHTTSDDPTRYRQEDELATWRDARDPLNRLRIYLEREGLWDRTRQEALEEDARQWVARAVTAALNEPVPPPEAMFDHVYAEPTPSLQAQREEVRALGAQEEGHHG
jgi:TPP-dependent pyruvate/acetoin dehydrogenase alpha subunit